MTTDDTLDSANEYQRLALRTAKRFPDGLTLTPRQADMIHALLGMIGELGELADPFKKHLIYGRELDLPNLIEERGDQNWYGSLFDEALGTPTAVINAQNIAKLRKRYPDRYTDADAIARADKAVAK